MGKGEREIQNEKGEDTFKDTVAQSVAVCNFFIRRLTALMKWHSQVAHTHTHTHTLHTQNWTFPLAVNFLGHF